MHKTAADHKKNQGLIAFGALLGFFALGPTQSRAAFDDLGSWDVPQETDFRAENLARYNAPWRLYHSFLSPQQENTVFSDSEGRLSPHFSVPRALDPQVRFWLRIYTQFSSHEAIIFDEDHPEIIYEVLDFRALARTSRNRAAFEIVSRSVVRERVSAFERALELLRSKKRNKPLSAEARKILAARSAVHDHTFTDAKRSLRVQWGQRDQVMEGLLASAGYLRRMESIFSQMDIPPELVLLSLVESSFHWAAVSHAGATGVWQFMPDTGKEFMVVQPNGAIDERLSPLKSTVAAGKLLRRNFRMLGSWPLAISAYNHGHTKWARLNASQLERLPQILAQCSRSKAPVKLGFASRNYYPEFLALMRAYRYQELIYGILPPERETPVRFALLLSPGAVHAVAKRFGLSEADFRRLNPDIRGATATLPAGFWVSIPSVSDDFSALIGAKRRVVRSTPANRNPRIRVAEELRVAIPRG
ncbi:MAG: lytic transglycosylase domain-containing protein [Bdellovibrionales bacterium]|nr:lytic transglycosylase domain-containing protein [Bdellovibrionales bacterium]